MISGQLNVRLTSSATRASVVVHSTEQRERFLAGVANFNSSVPFFWFAVFLEFLAMSQAIPTPSNSLFSSAHLYTRCGQFLAIHPFSNQSGTAILLAIQYGILILLTSIKSYPRNPKGSRENSLLFRASCNCALQFVNDIARPIGRSD